MRRLLVLVVLVVLPYVYAHPFDDSPLTFWNTFCSNQWQDVATASVSVSTSSVTPVTSDGSSSASSSTPSTISDPSVAFGSTNCEGTVSRQIRWENQVTDTGASDKIIVNTPMETLAIANQDN